LCGPAQYLLKRHVSCCGAVPAGCYMHQCGRDQGLEARSETVNVKAIVQVRLKTHPRAAIDHSLSTSAAYSGWQSDMQQQGSRSLFFHQL
jgi:hypothetical protein